MNKILELKNVTKSFDDFKLDDISFSLEPGYVMGFVGPNGSGKTTTIKLIMNLLLKDSGSINIFGMDNTRFEEDIKERIGFVYDENVYLDNLKLIDNAKLIAPFYKNWSWELFNTYIKRFELDKNKRLSKLSKGMKTKFNIAMALCHNADLIIMDEPTAGIDPVSRREILDIFYDVIQNEKKSILFSTHITSDLERIADYLTMINKGEIILSMPYTEVLEKFSLVKYPSSMDSLVDEKYLIGRIAGKYGIEALTKYKRAIVEVLGDSAIFEKPTIEDLMVHFKEEG